MARAKKPAETGQAGAPSGKTDYGIPAETFVVLWESKETVDDVYEALKAISEKAGRPVMPKPIILSRASEYRSSGVPLKKMRRVHADEVGKLAELVKQVRAGKEGAAPPQPATPPDGVLTRKEVEEIVVEVLGRMGLTGRGSPGKSSRR